MRILFRSYIFKNNLDFILVVIIAAILSFYNLGYSNYQGDEIKALFLPSAGQNLPQFLLEQRKGPMQFLITSLIKPISSNYTNEFIVRFPFALAGFLAVIVFYKLVVLIFLGIKPEIAKKVALYSSLFMATNGFFIAFSRIVQYQSVVILFSVLTLYFLVLATVNEKYKVSGLYLGLICWALAILSHYDGIFIAPIALFYLFKYLFKSDQKARWKHFLQASTLSALILCAFYIPFLASLNINTLNYWEGRLTGNVSAKLSSSYYLFTVYQPIYSVHIYLFLFALGVIFALIHKKFLEFLPIYIWLAISFLFWEQLVYIPGTHIYTYLQPMFIILGVGLYTLEIFSEKLLKLIKITGQRYINIGGVTLLFTFLFLQSFAVFVDNSREYPWQTEKFIIWEFPLPTPSFHLSMFGFPYYRNWEGIKNFISRSPNIEAYSTNERTSISRYFINLTKDANNAGFYIYIRDPQSFANAVLSEKAAYWANKYAPVYTYSKNGYDLVSIYLMEPGPLEEIIAKGF